MKLSYVVLYYPRPGCQLAIYPTAVFTDKKKLTSWLLERRTNAKDYGIWIFDNGIDGSFYHTGSELLKEWDDEARKGWFY